MFSCNLRCRLIFLHGNLCFRTYRVASLRAGPVGRISYNLNFDCKHVRSVTCDLINEYTIEIHPMSCPADNNSIQSGFNMHTNKINRSTSHTTFSCHQSINSQEMDSYHCYPWVTHYCELFKAYEYSHKLYANRIKYLMPILNIRIFNAHIKINFDRYVSFLYIPYNRRVVHRCSRWNQRFLRSMEEIWKSSLGRPVQSEY